MKCKTSQVFLFVMQYIVCYVSKAPMGNKTKLVLETCSLHVNRPYLQFSDQISEKQTHILQAPNYMEGS